MLCPLKTIVAWAVLAFVGTNLIGLVVRGFSWTAPTLDAPTDAVHELLGHETRRLSVANSAMTFLSILVTLAYLFGLFYFSGIGLSVAACIVMVSRLPDLLWEIRTGGRVTRQSAPQGALHIIATLFLFGTLSLIWYSLCTQPT